MSSNPPTKKPWYRLRWRTLLLLAVIGVVAWSGFSFWRDHSEQNTRTARELMSPDVGDTCRVILRGDATGIENSGVRWGEINGRANYVSGKFVRMNDDWLVINAAAQLGDQRVDKWIPREQVLVLEIEQ